MTTALSDYYANIDKLAQLAYLRQVQHFDTLPDSIKRQAHDVARLAGQEFHVQCRRVLGYSDGDTISYNKGMNRTGQAAFYLNENGHLWVRVTRLKTDGSLGKQVDTFPASTGGVSKLP